jgi:hypothetical protein
VKTPNDELREFVDAHGIPESADNLHPWLAAFLKTHEIRFAKPEYLLDWLREPERWMLGEPFTL